uniref:receptor protein-tyrosine kinase n=1 Tax=Culex tarsalis TaxID=7177 RepID=A0A1Q3G4D4_CULTA
MHNLSCLRRRPHRERQPAVIWCLLIVVVQMLHFGATNEANDMLRDLMVQNGAPEILLNQPDFELEVDSMMELSCQGTEPVKWIIKRTPDEEIEPEPDVLEIENYKTGVAEKPFGSRVTILKATAEIVGRYYCLYETAENTVDDIADLPPLYKADSTYIFVKDSQMVPVLNPVVHGVQYSEVIIPCKPSSKDGMVELVKDEHEMPVNHGGYSNTRGFTILAKSLEQSGLYKCRSLNNTEHEIHFELAVNEAYDYDQAVTEYIRKPQIEPQDDAFMKKGGTLKLNCTVNVAHDVQFNMWWQKSDKKRIETDSRITVSPVSAEQHPDLQHNKLGRIELAIKRVTIEDAGYYWCQVKDHNNHENNRAVKVYVIDQGEDFIKLTEDNNLSFINVSINKRDVRIRIKYSAHPTPVFYWTKDNDEKPLIHGEKYEVNVTAKDVTLIINRPAIDDAGTYTLHAHNEGSQATYDMKVYIKAKPILTMDPVYARPDEFVKFTCTCVGYPKPEMRFAFFPCRAEPWVNCSQPLLPKTITEYGLRQPDNGLHKDIITSEDFTFQASSPGYVGCSAVNSEGRAFAKADLLVSDLDEPVMIELVEPQAEVTLGDQVEIVCAATVYNHTDQIEFFLDGKLLEENNDEGISFAGWYERYAYRKKLLIADARKMHAGEIKCQTNLVDSNEVESKELRLEVYDPIAPWIVEGSGSETVELSMGDANQFLCSAEGTPKPKVEWLKDGQLMHFDNDNPVQVINDNTLFFQFAKQEDSGEYTCRAWNKVSSVEKKWTLKVKTVTIRRTWIYLVLFLLAFLVIAVFLISLFYYKKKKEVRTMKEAGLANFEEGNLDQMNPELTLDEQADLLPYKSEYEFPKEKLKLGKQLGAGAFGVVMKATAYGIMVNEDETTVAVKMVKKQTDNEVMRALISELKIMVHLGQHLNVVNLLGAVTKNIAKRELMVIVEYCRFGNVQNFLLRHRTYFIDQVNTETGEIDSSIEKNQLRWSKAGYTYNSTNSGDYSNPKAHVNSKGYVRHSGIQNMGMLDSCNTEATVMTSVEGEELNTANTVSSNEPLWRSNYGMDYKGPARSVTTTDLVCWAAQVACGMEYLASRKVLHGDLAARNILLCDDNVVKICDFGLARSMYKSDNYKKKGEAPLPFKWLALECISDNVFGTYSDVWAYGIVLWEFFTLAKIPYPGMEANQELYNKLRDGYRMDKPQYANQDIYDIMLNCWNVKPDTRPSFKDLKSRFNAMLPEELRNHYIDLNEPYLAMNTEKEQRGEPDYLVSLAPPEEMAPPAPPTYVNGIILPLPPISDNPDYLKMTNAKSDSEESQFDFAAFANSQPSPTLKNNLDSSPQQGSKRHKKKGIPEEIPMLRNNGTSFNSDSETEATSPVPSVRTTKITQPDHEYANLKRIRDADATATGNNDAFSNPGYVVVNTVNEKRSK